MSASPMKPILKIGKRPHPVNRKYGNPRLALYWANRRDFTSPGLHLWTGGRHVRLLPMPRRPR